MILKQIKLSRQERDRLIRIKAKIGFIAPVEVFPGEDEIASLAENGYLILEGKTKIHTYNKDRIIED